LETIADVRVGENVDTVAKGRGHKWNEHSLECSIGTKSFVDWLVSTFLEVLGRWEMMKRDPIERRFGWLRQLSGANYYISVRQVLESDQKKLRVLLLLKFSGLFLGDIDAAI